MSLEKIYDDMTTEQEITAERILNLLIESDKHINMKTHILSPIEVATLDAYITHLQDIGLKKTAKFLTNYLLRYKEYMVSYERKSRKEIVDALIALREQKQNTRFTEKLLGMNEERRK